MIVVNGESQYVPNGSTIMDLIQTLGLNGKRIAVELNQNVSPRSAHPTLELKQNDHIEIIHAVGGG
jgi:sulfur carrier protein